jgi:uncharacterized protein YjiS (DUF1127 family)
MVPYYSGNSFIRGGDRAVIRGADILLIDNAQENCMSPIKKLDIETSFARAKSLTWVERLHGQVAAIEGDVRSHGMRETSPTTFEHLVDGFVLGTTSIYSSPWHFYSHDFYGANPAGDDSGNTHSVEPWSYGGSMPRLGSCEGAEWLRGDIAGSGPADARVSNDNDGRGENGKGVTPSIPVRWLIGLKSAIARVFDRLEHRRKIACSRWSLMQLDDRLLQDIGLEREQVGYAVRCGRDMDSYR